MSVAKVRAVISGGTPGLHPALSALAICDAGAADAVAAVGVTWAWHGVLPQTAVCECTAWPGAGKTTLASVLGVAMCAPPDRPVRLLGRLVTPMAEGRRAVFVFGENAKASAVAQIDRAIEALGVDRAYAWSRIALLARANVVATPQGDWREIGHAAAGGDAWAALFVSARDKAIGFLALDTRAVIFGGLDLDPNAEEQVQVARKLAGLADLGGFPVLLTSHARKGAVGADVSAVAGSGQRAAGADVVLVLSARREKGKVLSTTITVAKNRDDVDGDGPGELTFALVRNAEGRWQITTDAGDLSPSDRVLDVLRRAGAPMGTRALREAARVSGTRLNQILEAMLRGRQVAASGANGSRRWSYVPTAGETWGVEDV